MEWLAIYAMNLILFIWRKACFPRNSEILREQVDVLIVVLRFEVPKIP